MKLHTTSDGRLDQEAIRVYQRALRALEAAGIPYLVGGAYALARYTNIIRHTKDFDIFLRPSDVDQALEALAGLGYATELTFPHWLGKAYYGEYFVDLIFSAGNGVAEVDAAWFEHAVEEDVLDMQVKLIPAEEMIWSKGFVMERERYDGSDVMHLLLVMGEHMDWRRLIDRFDRHWQVLLHYLVLFDFVYPGERGRIPGWVWDELLGRLQVERQARPIQGKLCQGTLISRAQFLIDILEWGYRDARLMPRGKLTEEEIGYWTEAIDKEE